MKTMKRVKSRFPGEFGKQVGKGIQYVRTRTWQNWIPTYIRYVVYIAMGKFAL